MNPTDHSPLTWPMLSAFNGLTTPIFVFDAERARIRWANEAARALWRAASIDALLERDFSDMSDVARARFDGVMETLRRGEKVARDWTLFPFTGEPVNCLMTISGIVLEDGRLASLHEAQPIDPQLISPSLLRGIEVVRHTGSKISLHRKDGVAVMRNPAATRAFGPSNEAAGVNDLARHLGGAAEAERALRVIARGEVYNASTPLLTRQGQRWHHVGARSVPDPVSGEAMILIDAQDISESHFAERMLATENRLMQMIAGGAPLDKIAHALVQAVEQFSSDMLCSLQLLNDEENRLDLAAGPSLPPAYRRAIENLPIGRGMAVWFRDQTSIAEADEARSHAGHINADLAIAHGLYPSWSMPVVSSTGEVFGALTGYYRQRREPDAQALRIIDSVRHLAGIAVERIRAAHALEQSAQYLRLVIDSVPALVAYVDREERFRFINRTFERWFGQSSEQIHGMKVESVAGPDLYRVVKPYVDRALAGETVTYERHQPVANAASRYLEVTYVPDIAESGAGMGETRREVRGFVSLMTDITARRADEERLHFLARHDQLTGLPNRALFIEHLSFALTQAARNTAKVAVLFIDLDRFKNVNDTLGHPIGDRLLQAVAKRFRGGVREGDTVARFGGDEFTILISAFTDMQSLGQIAQKVLDTLAAQLNIGGNELYATASIGISIFPDDAQDVATLIRNSDIAMYRAKDLGKNTYAFFSASASSERYEHLRLETSLRRSLEHNELEVHYQPCVSVESGRILGMEALLRWNHPQLGTIPPMEFIPLAEEIGLIVPIGEWVIRTVCAQVKAWQNRGFATGCTSINLSALQFRQLDLAATIARILDETGLAAESIELELTESSVMADADEAIAVLYALKSMGLRLAIDDFGTGYSSLSYLKRFPIDTLKIDQSFVRDIVTDSGDAAITEAVIAMAMSLRLRVIAEGVETREQLAFLRKHRCHEAQGYLFSPPLPAHQFERLLIVNTTFPVDG